MNRSSFLNLVPRPVRIAAGIIALLAVLVAIGGAIVYAATGGSTYWSPLFSVALLVGGFLLSTWLLGLGYIYADARRRAMRPVLWLLVALLFPHLLGFLLYFVLREPIAYICPHCGNTTRPGQRFCSWCGKPLTLAGPPPTAPPPTPGLTMP